MYVSNMFVDVVCRCSMCLCACVRVHPSHTVARAMGGAGTMAGRSPEVQ
jgi:hypothetical protein